MAAKDSEFVPRTGGGTSPQPSGPISNLAGARGAVFNPFLDLAGSNTVPQLVKNIPAPRLPNQQRKNLTTGLGIGALLALLVRGFI